MFVADGVATDLSPVRGDMFVADGVEINVSNPVGMFAECERQIVRQWTCRP